MNMNMAWVWLVIVWEWGVIHFIIIPPPLDDSTPTPMHIHIYTTPLIPIPPQLHQRGKVEKWKVLNQPSGMTNDNNSNSNSNNNSSSNNNNNNNSSQPQMAKRAYWLCRVIREAIYGHVWAAYVLKRTTNGNGNGNDGRPLEPEELRRRSNETMSDTHVMMPMDVLTDNRDLYCVMPFVYV